jgi:hypothetical protein
MTNEIHDINFLRQKVLSGEDLTPEETRTALDALRGDRKGVGGEQTTTAGKSKKAPLNLNDLFTPKES